MSWFGTDFVALGCILGSAAVGGAATLAVMDSSDHGQRCGVEAVAVAPRIAIAHSGSAHGRVVVTPNIRVHNKRRCPDERREHIEIHLDHQLHEVEAHLEQLDQALEIQMEALESEIEAKLEHELEARLHFEEAVQELQEAKIKMIVRKVEGGGI
jgi:hypothetical protein